MDDDVDKDTLDSPAETSNEQETESMLQKVEKEEKIEEEPQYVPRGRISCIIFSKP